MRFILISIISFFLFSFVAYAVDSDEAEKRYIVLVEKIKNGGNKEEYGELRQVFVQTERYNPYNSIEENLREDMAKAMGDQEWSKCIELADKALDNNYLYIRGHLNASYCYTKLENKEKADFHVEIFRRLVQAIADTGDGKSPETAFKTISTNEVHSFLLLSGYIRKRQALIEADNGMFDLMTVTDRETDEEFGLYFDVNLQMSHFFKALAE